MTVKQLILRKANSLRRGSASPPGTMNIVSSCRKSLTTQYRFPNGQRMIRFAQKQE